VSKNQYFKAFTFSELVEMVRTISRTKHESRTGVWKEGVGLESMENLEAHVDDILEELAQRIRHSWSTDRIQKNFRSNSVSLPSDILNLNNLNASQLNFMLYKDSNAVGSEVNDKGEEEIYIYFNNLKYKMSHDGSIIVG